MNIIVGIIAIVVSFYIIKKFSFRSLYDTIERYKMIVNGGLAYGGGANVLGPAKIILNQIIKINEILSYYLLCTYVELKATDKTKTGEKKYYIISFVLYLVARFFSSGSRQREIFFIVAMVTVSFLYGISRKWKKELERANRKFVIRFALLSTIMLYAFYYLGFAGGIRYTSNKMVSDLNTMIYSYLVHILYFAGYDAFATQVFGMYYCIIIVGIMLMYYIFAIKKLRLNFSVSFAIKKENKKRIRNIYKCGWGGIIIFIPFIKPSSLKYISPLLDNIFNLWLGFVLIYLLIKFYAEGVRLDKCFWGICFFWAFHFVITLNNIHGEIIPLMIIWAKMIAIYLYVKVEILYNHISTRCMLVPIETIMLLNIVLFLVFPNGMYTMIGSNGSYYSDQVWLIGGKNGYLHYTFFAIAVYILGRERKDIKHESIFLFALIFVNTFLISKSATLIVAVSMILIYLFLDKIRLLGNKRVTVLYFLIFIAIFYLFIFSGENSFLLRTLTSFMGKSMTLTRRTTIWIRSIEAIMQKWLLGYGIEDPLWTVKIIGQSTSHNKYLWILYRGGIIALVIFIHLLYCSLKTLKRHYSLKISRHYMLMLLVLTILYFVEVYDNNMLIFAFLLMCYFMNILGNDVSNMKQREKQFHKV